MIANIADVQQFVIRFAAIFSARMFHTKSHHCFVVPLQINLLFLRSLLLLFLRLGRVSWQPPL
jgi:hypothetical protein